MIADGMVAQTSEYPDFMNPAEVDRFLYMVSGVVGALFAALGIYFALARKKQKKKPETTKDDIQI